MLNFGFNFAGKGAMNSCPRPNGELLDNWTFDCGTRNWSFAPVYPATITDNGDGSLHLKTDSDWGSLVPVHQTYPDNSYIIEVKFRNQVGNGKISFRRPNNSWVSTPTIGDGVHQSAVFNGAIKEIHVGADSDPSYEADYEYISLKVHTADNVIFNNNNVVFNGNNVIFGG